MIIPFSLLSPRPSSSSSSTSCWKKKVLFVSAILGVYHLVAETTPRAIACSYDNYRWSPASHDEQRVQSLDENNKFRSYCHDSLSSSFLLSPFLVVHAATPAWGTAITRNARIARFSAATAPNSGIQTIQILRGGASDRPYHQQGYPQNLPPARSKTDMNQMTPVSQDEIQPQQQQQGSEPPPAAAAGMYDPSSYEDNSNDYYNYDDNNYNYYNNDDPYAVPPPVGFGETGEDPFPQETVQDRVERWKTQQREKAMLTAQDIPNSGQEQTSSLFATVSKGARFTIFLLQMWRDISLYETADRVFSQRGGSKSGAIRAIVVTPLVFLLVANLGGAMASLSSSSSPAKKRRLKAILNVNKIVEVVLMIYYALRLTFFPNRYTPREIYISGFFHSVLFMVQANAFTRVSWNDEQEPEFTKAALSSYDQDDDDDDDGDDNDQHSAANAGRMNYDSWDNNNNQDPTSNYYGVTSRYSQYDNRPPSQQPQEPMYQPDPKNRFYN